jgi:hypothetical protein
MRRRWGGLLDGAVRQLSSGAQQEVSGAAAPGRAPSQLCDDARRARPSQAAPPRPRHATADTPAPRPPHAPQRVVPAEIVAFLSRRQQALLRAPEDLVAALERFFSGATPRAQAAVAQRLCSSAASPLGEPPHHPGACQQAQRRAAPCHARAAPHAPRSLHRRVWPQGRGAQGARPAAHGPAEAAVTQPGQGRRQRLPAAAGGGGGWRRGAQAAGAHD